MYLVLFLVFLGLCFVLISLGLYRPEHTEFCLVGFAFLFILSAVFISGDVQYKVGTNTTYTYDCFDPCETGENNTMVALTVESDVYETFEAGGILSHTVGYWLAVLAVVGFILTLINLKRPEWLGRGD